MTRDESDGASNRTKTKSKASKTQNKKEREAAAQPTDLQNLKPHVSAYQLLQKTRHFSLETKCKMNVCNTKHGVTFLMNKIQHVLLYLLLELTGVVTLLL